MHVARILNMVLAGLGMAVFGAVFVYVSAAPQDFDRRTRALAIAEVERRVDDRLDEVARSPAAGRIADIAGRVSPRLGKRADVLRLALERGADDLVADMLAAACRPDCARREAASEALRDYYEATEARYGFALDRLERIVIGEYDAVMGELRADLRIFAGCNFLAMALAFLLAVFRGPASRHLLPVSLALTASTAVAMLWYVFGQDWAMTVVFSDYWGWGYAAWLGLLSALLADVAVNRARMTSAALNALGGAFSPC